jgi:AAA+ ATPase superfamily predicted ATPase
LQKNIIRSYLTIGSPLLDEPDNVLRQEIRELAGYNSVFKAVASGSAKYSEIASKSRLAGGNISAYLDGLVSLNLIRREIPSYTGESNKALYRVDDNMFGFWYRFIPQALSLVNAGKGELAYPAIEKDLDQYMGGVFERICAEYLWELNGGDRLPFVFKEAGRWWGGNAVRKQAAEIDIIAHDGDSAALFVECKWSRNSVGVDVLQDLAEKSELPQFARVVEKHLALFSRSGFTKDCKEQAARMGKVQLVTLKDMLPAFL